MNEEVFTVFKYCQENNIECEYNSTYLDGCEIMDFTISFDYNEDYLEYFNELNIFNNVSITRTFGGGRNNKFVIMSYIYAQIDPTNKWFWVGRYKSKRLDKKIKRFRKIKMILKSEDIKNYPYILNQEQMDFDKYNRFDIENGCIYYEDKDGNVYKDKEEYLTETRDQNYYPKLKKN